MNLASGKLSAGDAPALPQFKTTVFEGPLALLIHLIRANEVDIYDIPIASIAEQFILWLNVIEVLDLDSVGEYLVMAATLVEIKSRMLLPRLPSEQGEDGEDDDPRRELVERLIEYQSFHDAVDTFATWEEARRLLYFRSGAEPDDDYVLPLLPGEASVEKLVAALSRVLARAGAMDTQIATSIAPKRRLSLRLKIAAIGRKIVAAGVAGLPFDELFDWPTERTEIVLSFLAVLELIRNGSIRFEQVAPLSELRLYTIGAA